MGIYLGIDEAKGRIKNPVLTIGNFDGVHKGHLALFEVIKGKARDIHGTSVVLTFDPHPLKVLAPHKAPELLASPEEKVQLILKAGVDAVICQEFTLDFARMGPKDFVENILVSDLKIKEIVVGYDYGFGRNREGNIDLLRELGERRGFKVYVLQPVNINGRLVSSTAVRNSLKEGDMRLAMSLLGRYYTLSGEVVKGKGRGKSILDIPTANMEVKDRLIPRPGVYATFTYVKGNCYQSVTNIGTNPTFDNGSMSIETHVLQYIGDLIGEVITVEFIEYIRREVKFNSISDLRAQILYDIEKARSLLKL